MSEDVSQINKRRVKNYKEGNSSLFILPKKSVFEMSDAGHHHSYLVFVAIVYT